MLSLPFFLTQFWPHGPLWSPFSFQKLFAWRVLSPLVIICLKTFYLCFGLSHGIFKAGSSDSLVCRHLVRRSGYDAQILFEEKGNHELQLFE